MVLHGSFEDGVLPSYAQVYCAFADERGDVGCWEKNTVDWPIYISERVWILVSVRDVQSDGEIDT